MSPLEALLLELVPTRPDPAPHRGPWTQGQQDEHWAQLCEAVGTPGAERPQRLAEAA
ncbi:hypothetical protein MQE23_08630 [Streptomyces sp. HP-A2021]|uniref:hypothetical protein n=1 Tax=Streptomyces sp. HP-A2021 TaxID=2927875 RepID=UPI001FB02E70|nr:hypothetical protein [Streptomyces sp. HP-A2021]UOB09117.1 hypothetical protein MQE23_08630 [Streptomyces sp. HP-A2021]